MNENERIEAIHHEPHFENFDYYTDYSETPDSITSSSQYTNNDCMVNTNDTDNNNNVNGALNNSDKSNCKEENNQQTTNDTEWLTTSTSASTTTPTTTAPQSDTIERSEPRTDSSCSELSASVDGNSIKKSETPSANATIKSPTKQNTNKKVAKCKKVSACKLHFRFLFIFNSFSNVK